MVNLGYKIVDLHTHLRDKIPFHTKFAKQSGIGTILYMANTTPPLDNVIEIKKSLKQKRYIKALPVGAITIGRKGERLVDVDKIAPYVASFSDDGDCLRDLDLLAEILKKKVLVLAHLEPETEMAEKYLKVLATLRQSSGQGVGGRLHLQHISCAATIKIIRQAKKSGLHFTCETCPHYFTYYNEVEDKPVNPPFGTFKDIEAIKEGLKDGTIDCIASDYAPVPRPKGTGIASFSSFIPLSFGLVLEGVLTKSQLKQKIHTNPLKIIRKR